MPTSALQVSAEIAFESPKGYSQLELQEIAATVPAIYDRIADGWTGPQFLNLRLSHDQNERRLGDTYAALFRDAPSSQPLAAAYDGTDLVVDKGNHRIRAAQSIGVPVLPVWVSAPDVAQLDRVERACNRRIEREGAAAYRDAHIAHEVSAGYERPTSRERLLGEHLERDWQTPERER